MEHCEVSRPTLREALRLLEAQDLTVVRLLSWAGRLPSQWERGGSSRGNPAADPPSHAR